MCLFLQKRHDLEAQGGISSCASRIFFLRRKKFQVAPLVLWVCNRWIFRRLCIAVFVAIRREKECLIETSSLAFGVCVVAAGCSLHPYVSCAPLVSFACYLMRCFFISLKMFLHYREIKRLSVFYCRLISIFADKLCSMSLSVSLLAVQCPDMAQ